MNEKKDSIKDFLCSTGGRIVMICVFYVLMLLLMFGAVTLIDQSAFLVVALVFAVCGWKALNRIQPFYFLFLSWMGWLIYFVVKGLLSYIIGAFIAPFIISKFIVNKIQQSASNIEE